MAAARAQRTETENTIFEIVIVEVRKLDSWLRQVFCCKFRGVLEVGGCDDVFCLWRGRTD